MERHVIKGHGKHRGKYLCYARMAGLPPDNGFVWLPEQRKAARWDDPRYRGHTWATDQARKHNGYFVKMVAPPAIVARVDELKAFISGHARRTEPKVGCYWFDGDFLDAGNDYCRDCAEKLVDEEYAKDPKAFADLYPECESAEERYDAAIDGGSDTEHDHSPYCETCGADLRGNLTEYGADQEIEAYTGPCALAFDDGHGWDGLDDAIVNLDDDDPRWRAIARVVDAAMVEEQKAEQAAAALAVSPGMPEARTALVSLLAARKEQKAPEPSYRLWTELLAWHRLPYQTRQHDKDAAALEKRMVKAAKRFADALGLKSYWSGGLFMIRDVYWPFTVKREQYLLWQTKAYVEGQVYRRHSRHHRDANPYPDGTDEHEQWDAGYAS